MCTGFFPMINKPTHFKGESASCIDQIWTNIVSENMSSGIISTSVSAHMPVFALLPTTAKSMFTPETNPNTAYVYNISIKNIEKFETKLSGLNSDAIVAELKVNTNISAQESGSSVTV